MSTLTQATSTSTIRLCSSYSHLSYFHIVSIPIPSLPQLDTLTPHSCRVSFHNLPHPQAHYHNLFLPSFLHPFIRWISCSLPACLATCFLASFSPLPSLFLHFLHSFRLSTWLRACLVDFSGLLFLLPSLLHSFIQFLLAWLTAPVFNPLPISLDSFHHLNIFTHSRLTLFFPSFLTYFLACLLAPSLIHSLYLDCLLHSFLPSLPPSHSFLIPPCASLRFCEQGRV